MPAFTDLALSPTLQTTLAALDFRQPTPIQSAAIPPILAGKDILAQAQTGTGKTAAFALPIIEQLSQTPAADTYHPIRALVLVPTRELAIQVQEQTLALGKQAKMRVIALYGGVRFDNQIRKMKNGADILVATPGRLLAMLTQHKFDLQALQVLVLDEADRMLDLGFSEPLQKILAFTPARYQTLLFSATFNPAVEALADTLLNQPERIRVGRHNSSAGKIRQHAFAVEQRDKADITSYLLHQENWSGTLIFTRTKQRADQLADYLQQDGISAAALHGDKPQKARLAALAAFSQQRIRVLVATDVAARGLDIPALPRVINYDLPRQAEDYVHRIGRTGRAGQAGLAISLVAPDERHLLLAISQLTGQSLALHAVPQFQHGQMQPSPTIKTKQQTQQRGKKTAHRRPNPQTKTSQSDASQQSAKPGKPALRRSLFSK